MKRREFVVTTAALSATACLAGQATDDWPQFRGLRGAGLAATAAPVSFGLNRNLLWKVALPGPGASSPIVIGNRVYVTSYSGFGVPGETGSLDQLRRHLGCLERDTGRVIWTRDGLAKQPEPATIRENHGYAASTPTADTERVYVFFGKSGVHALDHSGRPLWQYDVGNGTNGWGSAASPVLWGDLLFVNASVESESLVALDRRTGREVWRARGIRESWNAPSFVQLPGGQVELVVAIFGKVLGFDPTSGTQLWSCATDIAWYMVPGLVAQGDSVFCIGGRTGGALAVKAGGRGDVTGTHRTWTGRKGSNVSSPIVHQGHLYWAHDSLGIVYCAEATTGRLVYEERIDRASQIYASPVLAGGRLYYLTRSGRMLVLPATPTFEPPIVNDVNDGSMYNSSPAVAGGRLYVRSNLALYCFAGN